MCALLLSFLPCPCLEQALVVSSFFHWSGFSLTVNCMNKGRKQVTNDWCKQEKTSFHSGKSTIRRFEDIWKMTCLVPTYLKISWPQVKHSTRDWDFDITSRYQRWKPSLKALNPQQWWKRVRRERKNKREWRKVDQKVTFKRTEFRHFAQVTNPSLEQRIRIPRSSDSTRQTARATTHALERTSTTHRISGRPAKILGASRDHSGKHSFARVTRKRKEILECNNLPTLRNFIPEIREGLKPKDKPIQMETQPLT